MSNLPTATTPLYATDEDILVRAGGDFAILCPPWQTMAAGTDGVFANGAPWVLTSVAVNFETNGVAANQVVQLTAPAANFKGGGQFLAIDSVSGHSVTLRRPYKDLGVGQPPAPAAGLSGVAFAINTLGPQIDEASFDLKMRYSIDEGLSLRASGWVRDLRVLRTATVLSVLLDRYTQETRTDRGDFDKKVGRVRQQLAGVLDRLQIDWGPRGSITPPTTSFGARLTR